MSNNYFNSTGTIGFTCDVCGRELRSCTWINGMRFCAKCYQETFGASKDWQLLDKDKTIAEQQKQIADLEAKLAEKQSKIQELNDMYEDLLCVKGTEHELKQAIEDIEMLDERNLCLFSLLYETLEKQGCENITSTIEQMTNLHLKKCSHWYKNNRVCDELQKQLAEKEKEIAEYKRVCTISHIEDLQVENMLLKGKVLPVEDFEFILKMVNEELDYLERKVPQYRILRSKDKLVAKYKELLHLKNSLEKLNI